MARPAVWWRRWVMAGTSGVNGVMLVNLLLAAVAFGKDLLQAAYFGTSSVADALTVAFFIPDTIGNNLMGFAMGVACVPMFAKLLVQGDRERFWRVVLQVAVCAFLLAGGICGLVYLFCDPLLRVLGSGWQGEVLQTCARLTYVMLPTMVLFPLSLIGSAALQARGRFVAAAMAPVVYNCFWFCGLLVVLLRQFEQKQGAVEVAAWIVAGVVGMVAVVGAAVWRQRQGEKMEATERTFPSQQTRQPQQYRESRRSWRLGWRHVWPLDSDILRVVYTFVPFLLILLYAQLTYAVERNLASTMGHGTVAALNYAFRLGQFPNWVFIAALTMVLLPAMSKAIGQGDPQQTKRALNGAIKATLLLTLPMSLVLYAGRVPIVALLFQHGAFDHHSLLVTTDLLAGYALAIVPQALSNIGLRYFMAIERMNGAMGISLAAFLVNVACDVWLTRWIGAAGLGYGAACGGVVQAAGLWLLARRDLQNLHKKGASDESFPDHHSFVQ